MMSITKFKYPRTVHLPWSAGVDADDIRCIDTRQFIGREVVITEKMDGENSSLYRHGCHARSLDSVNHPSRDWLKQFHAAIAADIPPQWRICGENLYARHALAYTRLQSYFYGFSIWDEQNICLSWDDTQLWFSLLGIVSPRVLYRGPWDEKFIRTLTIDTRQMEGYVVRLADAFHYDAFAVSVAKWVRAGHVQTGKHWMYAEVVANGLAPVTQEAQ
ncbi:RNA ligase family protein [Shewanella sp. NFH-SH190041]|uniref:RNA ligase family protein n=1 Tax=Shewanella sp. NFH-SH190041 TaxID=2950245 RepID=UPI0021C4582D|nr:RNA ligase family protein [Shewanella sp. NFH-SH190041]